MKTMFIIPHQQENKAQITIGEIKISSLEKKKLHLKLVNTFQRRKKIMNRKIRFAAAALAAVVSLG